MMKISTITTLIWLAATALCHAQDEARDRSLLERLSCGIAFGVSVPSGNGGTAPGDPIYLFDNATVRGVFAVTASYWLTSHLALDLTLEVPVEDTRETALGIQRERIERAYPDYLLEAHQMITQPSFLLPSLGLSYSFRFGAMSVEPGLLACYSVVEPADLSIQLKRKGANDYRSIIHQSSGGGAFALVPALICRYTFEEGNYRYGLYLRTAYFSASPDTPYSTSDESLGAPPRTTSYTTHHSFQAVHIALGIHCSLL